MLINVGYWPFLENEFYNSEVEGDAAYCHDARGSLMSNLEDELKDILQNNQIDTSELEELEEMIAPTCGCGCGGVCW